MTEEIIIDGVNVAGCEFYLVNDNDFNCCCDMESSCQCRDNPNCYYKQLKRLEQENARLKEGISQLKDDIATETMCIQCKTAFEKCKTYADTEGLRVDAARAKMKAKKYKQTLQEKKEIAENNIEYFEILNVKNGLKNILQKITKAEVSE